MYCHPAIKSGRLSAARGDNGEYLIDGSELARAFPPEQRMNKDLKQHEQDAEAAVLAAKLDAEQRINAELRARVADVTEDVTAGAVRPSAWYWPGRVGEGGGAGRGTGRRIWQKRGTG